MAQHVEPMDVDCMDSDFDNKENTYLHNNVLPCTEKGYEELDVSELNMKLRYSMTPASSPMSKSYTAHLDNKNLDTDDSLNCINENSNLTRSLNSTMTKNDSVIKSLKSLPLQSLPTEQFIDGNGNASVLRQLDSTLTENANITVTVSGTNDIYENISLPSSSSSALHTPEATTPTKDIKDGGSPIMRGLKSVFNMFRASQSPIPPDANIKQELSPADVSIKENVKPQASTPIAAHKNKDGNNSKRSSPLKDSIVFNDDLEKELSWKDETTILFSEERIPIHKLFLQQKKPTITEQPTEKRNMNATVEFMDVSYNESMVKDRTVTEVVEDQKNVAAESDSEFVDCETTFGKNEEENVNNTVTVEQNFYNTSNTQEQNDNVNISSVSDKTTLGIAPSVSDITGISFTKDDCKNKTIPSDFSDYSKETTDILSELEKLEEIVSPKPQTDDKLNTELDLSNESHLINNETFDDKENTLEIKELTVEQLDVTKEILQPVEDLTLMSDIANITQTIETAAEITHEPDNEIKNMEINALINEAIENVLPNNEIHDNKSVILTDGNLELISEVINTDKSLDTLDRDLQNVDSQLIDVNKCEMSDISSIKQTDETIILEPLSNIENEPSSETETNLLSEVLLTCEESSKDPSSSDDTNKTTSEEIVANIENPSDLPLPDDDDTDKEILLEEVQSTVSEENVPVIPPATLDMTSTLTTGASENAEEIEISNKIVEDSFLPQDIPIQSLKSVLGTAAELILNVTDTLSKSSTETIQETDIVLPDIKNDSEIPDDKNNTILPEVNNDIVLPELANDIVLPEISNEIAPPVLKDQIELTEITNNTVSSENVLSVTENSIVMPVCNNEIGAEIKTNTIEPQIIDTIIHTSLSENLNVQSIIPHSIAISDNHCTKPVIESPATNDIVMPEVVSNVTFNQSFECVSNELTYNVNNSIHLVETLDVTMNNVEANVSGNEPMDISMNESLKQTDLPDLANQTVTMAEANLDNVDSGNVTIDMPKSETEIVLIEETNINLEAPLEDITANAENKIDAETSLNIEVNENAKSDISQLNEQEVIGVSEMKVDSEVEIINTIESNEVKIESVIQINEGEPAKPVIDVPHAVDSKVTTVDEEIIVSENNSPYVSVMAGIETVPQDNSNEIENPFHTSIKIASSPPITSKGYNFNFDEIGDPFATKTKIRLSPPLDTPTKSVEPEAEQVKQINSKRQAMNRRKSQPLERKKPAAGKKKFNTTFDAKSTPTKELDLASQSLNNTTSNVDFISNTSDTIKEIEPIRTDASDIISVSPTLQELSVTKETNNSFSKTDENQENTHVPEKPFESCEDIKTSIDSITAVSSETKTTSSSEQSTYYSAGTSSTESFKAKNVFNLPEIDDTNFNPFATKSKMRQSPTTDVEFDNPFATKSKMKSSPNTSIIISPQSDLNSTVNIDKELPENKSIEHDKTETELMEKEVSSNTSSSTKVMENITREVNTEDEDTEEGPFLEAEDMDKLSEIDDDNMMPFTNLPPQAVDDNMEGGELFIDAEAFEFLLNQNKSNVVADSGKESLFLKFDPLFAKRISSDGVLAALNKVQKRQSTPTKPARPSLRNEASPIAGPSTMNITYEGDNNASLETNEDLNVTVSKPMMVVTPAVNPVVTPRQKSMTPTRSNRRSITFTSPAIAVIDRLLSMSGNNSFVGQDTTITQTSRERNEADLALTQLRELLAEKEINVYNLRSESKELKDILATMESQVRILEASGQERLNKIKEQNEILIEKTKFNKSMATVVEEYERTIASLIAEIEQDKKRNAEEKMRLISERDEQTAHLASMEVSFSDLHSKYEKSKQVILACKANEESYKKSIKEFQENLAKMQTNYEMLKQHATSKLNHANQELERINRAHEAEVVKLNAMVKRKDLHITSLEETLAQKTKANEELTAICDELINKVG